MGTLGQTWTLSPKVKADRYKRWLETWKSKPRKHKKSTIIKIVKARKEQSLRGCAPETNEKIRSKIVSSMYRLRKTKAPHNKGKAGYSNNGTFKVGSGGNPRKMSIATRKKLQKTWADVEGKRARIAAHHNAVREIATRFRNQGKQVWTCFDSIPDIMIKDNGKLVAYEVTNWFTKTKTRNYPCAEFFDGIKWVDLTGRNWE